MEEKKNILGTNRWKIPWKHISQDHSHNLKTWCLLKIKIHTLMFVLLTFFFLNNEKNYRISEWTSQEMIIKITCIWEATCPNLLMETCNHQWIITLMTSPRIKANIRIFQGFQIENKENFCSRTFLFNHYFA